MIEPWRKGKGAYQSAASFGSHDSRHAPVASPLFFFLTKNTTTHLTILALIDERTDLSLLVPVARAARPILLDLLFHSTKAQPFTVNRGS